MKFFETSDSFLLRSSHILFSLYVISLFFTEIQLPGSLWEKTRLSDTLFIAFALASLPLVWKNREFLFRLFIDKKIRYLVIALLLWPIINIISSVVAQSYISLQESVGRLFLSLACLYSFVFFTFSKYRSFQSLTYGLWGWVASIVAICAVTLYCFGLWSGDYNWCSYWENYPYFGSIFRLEGVTASPAFFNSLLIPSFYLMVCVYKLNKSKWTLSALIFILISSALTFSKSSLLLVPAIMYLFTFRLYERIKPILWFSSILLFVGITHVVIIGNTKNQSLLQTNYIGKKALYKGTNFSLYPSSYLEMKKVAVNMFSRNCLIGVGTGRYNITLDEYKSVNQEITSVASFDPHSSWTGTMAENGIFGLMLIGVFSILFFFMKKELDSSSPHFIFYKWFFLMMLAESLCMDILNLRHYWFFIAVFTAQMVHDRFRLKLS